MGDVQPPTSQGEALGRGWACKCPACGQHPLYSGLVDPFAQCPNCDTDLQALSAADGPASFLIFGIGALILIAALILEVTVQPPIWLHLVLWIPAILGLTIFGLRYAKSILMALQYFNKSGSP